MAERRAAPPLPATGSVHVIGAGGAGMSALAKLLAGMGYRVTGSDLKPSRVLDALGDLGIETWVGHHPSRMAAADLVVFSSAVPQDDPEVVAAREAGGLVWPRPLLLEAVTARMPAIGFAGTHGKTTSTALAVTALRASGEDPTFIVGGEMMALNTGAHLGTGSWFALEADEAFGTFRHLWLDAMMVTNIEADHLDYYGTVAEMEQAFALVANRVDGPVVACIDDPGVRRLGERADIIGYGITEAAAWRMSDPVFAAASTDFTLTARDGTTHRVEVPVPGLHVARNAAGVIAVLSEMGCDTASLVSGVAGFRGVRRRFEVRGTVGGVTVVDDYAHHPTEVGATIAAGRLGGWGKVWAVFQPHRYTRTADLGAEFGRPLATADRVVVTDVYPAGEAPIPGVTGKIVAEAVAAAGGTVRYVAGVAAATDLLAGSVAPGDLVLLLGAGDITGVAEPLLAALELRALA
ncbi:MAG: UDP-N-acetylmuramate--L-alanine ligase [Actinomycetota bacterium]|nr:UDP-N-acetylmuramate--L-alanine ligase [Actinomycetota bacterium]